MPSWSKCFAKYPQTHESLLPEKVDARAATRFAEHQANYNVASHDKAYIHITVNEPPRNVPRRPTLFEIDGYRSGI